MGCGTTPTPVQVIYNSPNEERNERDQDIQQDGHGSPPPLSLLRVHPRHGIVSLAPAWRTTKALHAVTSGHRKAQLSRLLTRPDPLGAIALPRWHVSPDVPPVFAVSEHGRDGAHASGQPTERSWFSRLHLFDGKPVFAAYASRSGACPHLRMSMAKLRWLWLTFREVVCPACPVAS